MSAVSESRLFSTADATIQMAETFSPVLSSDEPLSLSLDVRDDRCLADWVSIGDLVLYPSRDDSLSTSDRLQHAFCYGFFEWTLPSFSDMETAFDHQIKKPKSQNKSYDNAIRRIAKAVVHVAWRCGLASPLFDAGAVSYLARLAPGQPVTVVADTNAVLHGALDFVMRQSTPNVEIKIPAIVHMEIVNFVDRYFIQRRHHKDSASMLSDHVKKSGQHVLLRLHLGDNRSIVRTSLGADPLRGIVQKDADAEDKSLNLDRVQRSFADRLILETAIRQLTAANIHHRVMLLTADQGLARMTLAEGATALFYDSNSVEDVFESTLSGVGIIPFTHGVAQRRLCTTSMAALLWEHAATFGGARLFHQSSATFFKVSSLATRWQPYHSRDNLMWTSWPDKLSTATRKRPPPAKQIDTDSGRQMSQKSASFMFNVNAMLKLLTNLYQESKISIDRCVEIIGVAENTFSRYRRFLVAGGFVRRSPNAMEKTTALDDFVVAMLQQEYDDIYGSLMRVPSFSNFAYALKAVVPLPVEHARIRPLAFSTYCTLAEMCVAGVRLDREGIYATPSRPLAHDFAAVAMKAYENTRNGDDYTLAGAWMEYLIKEEGIHPVVARRCLDEAHRNGYIRRFFEGSTPDTRYRDKNVSVLHAHGNDFVVRVANLYHGDFLMPGRAAVGLRLQLGDGNGT